MLGAEKRRAAGCLQVGSEDVPAEKGAVEFQGAESHEEQEEPAVVALPKTVVDPGAVVVEFGDAGFAEGAVFASGWFGDVAGPADVERSVEDVVVGVVVWVFGLGIEMVAGVGGGEVGEDVRKGER